MTENLQRIRWIDESNSVYFLDCQCVRHASNRNKYPAMVFWLLWWL